MKTLLKLVNNDTKPEPVVRDLSNGVSGRQAQVAAGGECVNLGRCLARGVGQLNKSKHHLHEGPLHGWPAGRLAACVAYMCTAFVSYSSLCFV